MYTLSYKNKLNLKNENPIGSWSYNTTLLGKNDPTTNPDPKNLSHVCIEFMAECLFSRSCSSLYDWGVLWLDVLMNYFYFQVKEILEQILQNHPKKTSKVLLVVASDQKARHMSSSLKLKNCTVIDDSQGSSFTICSRYSELNNIVVFLKFPVSACKLSKLVNLLAKPFSFQSLHANWTELVNLIKCCEKNFGFQS